MPDFFPTQRELTIGEIVALTRAEPREGAPLDRCIANIAPLDTAQASDITFLDNPKYLGELATRAQERVCWRRALRPQRRLGFRCWLPQNHIVLLSR